MLNTFPDLLTLSFIAPLILRIFLGIYLIKNGWKEISTYKNRNFSYIRLFKLLKVLGAFLLILGFLTQITSLFLMLIILFDISFKIKNNKLEKKELDLYIIIFGVLLSLILSGAGFLAIDIPL
ncbi:MAG: hypothetical protein KAJ58_00265 [Candidatus Pacebacteria bacterium]|nr:hypothetical protein [Candidatus Paceibacterota bacterium]